jgi:hypothetical protein
MTLSDRFPTTIQAVQEAARRVQAAWIAAAEGSTLAGSDQARYIHGLTQPGSVVYPDGGDPLAARVVNVAPEAARLESGAPSYHLPSVVRWSLSRAARRSKAGRWYLRIPFRHGTPRTGVGRLGVRAATLERTMTQGVYRVARLLRPGQRLTAGPTQGRALHAQGLNPYAPALAQNIRPGSAHQAREEGMRRVPGHRRGGAHYMTIRTMTPSSTGWWMPGKPGVRVAAEVVRAVMPQVHAMLAAAVRQDVEAALPQ